jgi:hypothetical protein
METSGFGVALTSFNFAAPAAAARKRSAAAQEVENHNKAPLY